MHANKDLLLISNKNDPITLTLNHVWDEYILKGQFTNENSVNVNSSFLFLWNLKEDILKQCVCFCQWTSKLFGKNVFFCVLHKKKMHEIILLIFIFG